MNVHVSHSLSPYKYICLQIWFLISIFIISVLVPGTSKTLLFDIFDICCMMTVNQKNPDHICWPTLQACDVTTDVYGKHSQIVLTAYQLLPS